MNQIAVVEEAEVPRVWITPEQEYSHRIVTTARQGAERLSFHLTTYAPGYQTDVSGDGVHEVVMFCLRGGAEVTVEGRDPIDFHPDMALYLPVEFAYSLAVGPSGMKVAVACTPPKE
jgi:L-ectoine synthase